MKTAHATPFSFIYINLQDKIKQSANAIFMQRKEVKSKLKIRLSVILLILVIALAFGAIFAQSIPKTQQNDNTSIEIMPYGGKDARLQRCANVVDREYVYISGRPIGISLSARGLIVLGQTAVQTEDGEVYPAKGLDIMSGDILVALNGESITSVYQFKTALKGVKDAKLKFLRQYREFECEITPVIDKISGEKRVGLLLKEDIGGIGTMTFITQDGNFASLGHHIVDQETGLSGELHDGYIYKTEIEGIVKGERGKAGGLVGDVNRLSTPIGDIKLNSEIGLFGDYTAQKEGELYRIAKKGEAKIGKAQVLTTIDGSEPKLYDIEIVKIISQNEPAEKGMVIVVRDDELLRRTGGIVQGMSGSPILQNGILIGAITHVFVQDPTRGYAVHSRFMYDYATSLKAE